MFVILGISFMSLYLWFFEKQKKHIEIWMEAAIIWCVLLLAKTEILSVFVKINGKMSWLFWGIVSILAVIGTIYRKNKFSIIKNESLAIKRIKLGNEFFLLGWGMIALAFLTVPYNWDSMTYHLPRVAYWAQNQSVAHYATNVVRQVASPPFHEFICLELYILSGKRDFLFNTIQCSAFLTNAWLIYEISRKLGCGEKFCKIGVLVFFSTPIAFGEALTTQNDNLACMFLLIFCWHLMDFLHIDKKIEDDKATCGKVWILSACIGLGYLTKPNVCIGMAILAFVLLVFCIIRKDSIVKLIKLLLLSATVIGLVLFPEIARNIQTFGTVFPTITGPRQIVGTLEPRYLLVNLLKNFTFNLPTGFIINSEGMLVSLVNNFAVLIGVDINASSISEDGRAFYLTRANLGHDTAVNPAVLYIFIFSLIWCFVRKKQTDRKQQIYTYIVFCLFIIMCMIVRWEPFVSRYMLPYLALLCPAISIWVEDMFFNAQNRVIKNCCVPIVCWIGITGLLLLFSYHVDIALKQGRSRSEGYFTNRREILEGYQQACDKVEETGAERIGLKTGEDAYQYPVYYMLKNSVKRIENVMVGNETAKYEDAAYIPDCILSTDDLGPVVEYHGSLYNKLTEGSLSVYAKQ